MKWPILYFITAVAGVVLPHLGAQPQREVNGNILVSSDLPALRMEVSPEFDYVGSFDFTLKGIAYGTRYIFVEADSDRQVKRLVIAQFEGFLPNNDHTYGYNLSSAEPMAGYPFRGNPYAYSNQAAEKNAPDAEAAKTVRFLRKKGYRFADIWRMYRWLTVPDKAKRHELILFYVEPEPDPTKTIDDFYAGDKETDYWKGFYPGLEQRARKAWTLKPLDP